ncbi:M15 family metallopeptidase [Miltoncostaea marina]|uniref:M15 family metallopeptidase n=1 Tax=Miltoncostaea marina TaxID=2843215 RepID=UPI001C3E57A0|nr:M15 family metallopeptidase [Miltoncostaea marina]
MAPLRPLPPLAPADGWREVPIEPRDEPLVRVADIGGRVRDEPRYLAAGLPGAMRGGWVREGVAERLRAAAEGLPDGLSLVVWDGYRTIETQAAIYDAYLAELVAVHPDWPVDALEEAASRFVTPPSRSHLAPPPHLTGGAVDVTLGDGDGRPLDLGTDFDAFVPEAAARALEDVPGGARDLRRVLFWALAEQGFTAYREEWWHFDHGDQFWGLVTGRPAFYAGAGNPEG